MEVESVDMGVARYKAARNTTSRLLTPEMRFVTDAISKLEPAILYRQKQVVTGEPAQGIRLWGPPLVSLSATKLAIITLVSMWNGRSEWSPLKMALRIADNCKLERDFQVYKREEPDDWNMLKAYTKNMNPHMARRISRRCKELDKAWTHSTRLHFGGLLISLCLEHTDLFYVTEYRHNGKTIRTYNLNPDVEEAVENQHEERAVLNPFNMPMLVPPKPWTTLDDGGYVYHRYPLVKQLYGVGEGTVEQAGINRLAVNVIQNTPYCINPIVLETADQLWKAGGDSKALVPLDKIPLPPRPADDAPKEQWSAWKAEAVQVYEQNGANAVKRRSILTQFSQARKFRKHGRFYYPWNMDFRGRMYPIPAFFNPQADDFGRGLIWFANATPLGDRGFHWLTVHLANCIGWDKDKYEDRVRKVEENADEIRRWATDPLRYKGWTETDDPFKCLAAADEWTRATRLDDPGRFESRLAIAADGTCNGLQHLSALGLDPVGAAATNLIPADRPADIYSQVADLVIAKVSADRFHEEPLIRQCAEFWMGRVTRKTVKQPTMTTPYNVTRNGMKKQLLFGGHVEASGAIKYQYASYMRDKIYQCVGDVVVAGRQIMDWFIVCSRVLGEAGYEARWETPGGFLVRHKYKTSAYKEMKTVLQKITYKVVQPKLDLTKQDRGIAPNYIHSMDACHLSSVVLRLHDEGVTDFGFVHDSYGVPACHVDRLHEITREEFVAMYRVNRLEEFRDYNRKMTHVDLPEPPPQGDLDIEQVLLSPYFFM